MNTQKDPRGNGKKGVADDMKATAEQTSQQAKAKSREQLEAQSSQAADTMDKMAEATGAAAEELSRKDEPNLSHYVSEIAEGIGGLSNSLRNKNTDELINDASRLARQNAGLFLLGSVAVGFGLSRIAKASKSGGDGETHWEDYYGQQSSTSYGAETPAASAETTAGAGSPARAEVPGSSHASTSYLPEERESAESPVNPPNAGMNTEGPKPGRSPE